MVFAPTVLAKGWAFDTNFKFTQASAAALLASPILTPKWAVKRYVSLGTPSPADITVVERDAIFAAGWLGLGLVQHVEMPHWIATPQNGQAHGAAAVAHAQLIGYPKGCHIGVDIEGLGNAGAPVQEYVTGWAQEVNGAGYLTLPYDGYDDGMSDAVKLALSYAGLVRPGDWWSDYGPRVLPTGLSWLLKQHSQVTMAGTPVDPDEVLVDNVLTVMGIVVDSSPDIDPAAGSGPDQPHT
jgi:Domain of unknown function (DUF1906)